MVGRVIQHDGTPLHGDPPPLSIRPLHIIEILRHAVLVLKVKIIFIEIICGETEVTNVSIHLCTKDDPSDKSSDPLRII